MPDGGQSVWSRSILAAAAVWSGLSVSSVCAADQLIILAHPAIDHTIYRDGEVRRLHGRFSAWSLVCDEIARLHQRFCSLRTLVSDSAGVTIAALTISTGEDGRPAGLLVLPPLPPKSQRVEIAPAGTPAAHIVHADRTLLTPAGCNATACAAVWSLTAGQIRALNAGDGLRVQFNLAVTQDDPTAIAFYGTTVSRQVAGLVNASGFATAVDASLQFGK